jgi:tetratricopeptide (TPR) repeat protein
VLPEGPVVVATPAVVARLAAARGARWVVSGWFERPAWQLRIRVIVWRVDGGQAELAAQQDVIGPIENAHAMVGAALVVLANKVGWRLPADAVGRLSAAPSKDFYAFTLVGKALGRWLGALEDADAKAPPPVPGLPSPLAPSLPSLPSLPAGPSTPAAQAALAAQAAAKRAAVGKELTRAVLIDPGMAVGQHLLGELWAIDPDPKVASRAAGKFALAVEVAPDYTPALAAAAERARATGKRDIALELFTRLVRRRPWDLDARVGLGDAAWQAGQPDLALRELGRVVARRP